MLNFNNTTNKFIQDIVITSCFLIVIGLIQSSVELSIRSSQHQERHRRTLTLDFETANGLARNDETPDHVHLPVDTESVNISCTITNPSAKYRLKLNKSNHGKNSTELIKLDDSYIINPELKKRDRLSISVNDDDDDTLKITLTIKKLELSDNGIYKCLYHGQSRQVHFVVYTPITQDNIITSVSDSVSDLKHDDKHISLMLGKEYTFECKTSSMYPRPMLKFLLNNNEVLDGSHQNRPLDGKLIDVYDGNLHATTASIKFIAKYKDNSNDLTCSANQNIPTRTAVSKTLNLQINGIEFINDECQQEVIAELDATNVEISCMYYAYPLTVETKWSYQQNVDDDGAQPTESATAEDAVDASQYQIVTNDKFSVTREILKPGIFKSILRFAEPLTEKDLKNYTLLVATNSEVRMRTIVLSTESTRVLQIKQENGQSSILASSIHSKILIGLLLVYFASCQFI